MLSNALENWEYIGKKNNEIILELKEYIIYGRIKTNI